MYPYAHDARVQPIAVMYHSTNQSEGTYDPNSTIELPCTRLLLSIHASFLPWKALGPVLLKCWQELGADEGIVLCSTPLPQPASAAEIKGAWKWPALPSQEQPMVHNSVLEVQQRLPTAAPDGGTGSMRKKL